MAKHHLLSLFFFLFSISAGAQKDTRDTSKLPPIFERIGREMKEYHLDTSAVPDDKITRKIRTLRNLRGGFNINEALEYKIEEDLQKNDITKEEAESRSHFFKTGNGKKWLDNAVIWIYRSHFTYKELKQLVRFYKKEAGQKLATDLPIIMLQTLTAAEKIGSMYANQKK